MKPERRGKKANIKWKEGEMIKWKDPDQKAQRIECIWDILTVIEISKYWTPVMRAFSISILRKCF